MSYVFSTDAVEQPHRFDYYQAAAAQSYVRAEYAVPDRKAFHGEIEVKNVAGLNLSLHRASALEADVGRSASLSAPDVVFMQIALSGQTLVTLDGVEVTTNPGEIALLDTTMPFHVRMPGESTHLILELPRAELLSRMDRVEVAHGRMFSIRDTETALTVNFLRTMFESGAPGDPVVANSMARQAVDLAALVLSGGDPATVRRLSSPAAISRLRLHHAVEESLLAGSASCDDVAGSAGISARYANMLLGQEGTSLERLLMRRRLEKCRDSLIDPAERQHAIGDIALRWGFNSPSHFARSFKDAYGTTARDFRESERGLSARKRSETRSATRLVRGNPPTPSKRKRVA